MIAGAAEMIAVLSAYSPTSAPRASEFTESILLTYLLLIVKTTGGTGSLGKDSAAKENHCDHHK